MEVKHLDGKKHTVATCPGEVINNEELKTIKGLGLPYYKDPMSHGNLFIEFIINFPKKNTLSALNIDKIGKVLNGIPLKS